ncbi:MAG: glycosyltransferase family 2 protein [Anaerolineae bacterium]|nr:glycosyltransferase family 2 protein [Anaerolineae bacterium]
MGSIPDVKTENPKASVVICTRNRGKSIVDAVETVLANKFLSFELLVIDQSTDRETENAITRYKADPRFRYIFTNTKGTGISRCLGLVEANGQYILYTDDDCTVPQDWIEKITNIFEANAKTGIVFSNVIPGEHDSEKGVIPNHSYEEDRTINSLLKYYKSIGMGAGMSVRRDFALAIGGFDQKLGPGSTFSSGEDHDMALRALLKGWNVHETNQTSVIHYGFRTYDQFRDLTVRDWVSMGAIYAKAFKSRQFSVLPIFLYNLLLRNFLKPLMMVLMFRKPQGFRRNIAFIQGFFAGLKVPVDSNQILYR